MNRSTAPILASRRGPALPGLVVALLGFTAAGCSQAPELVIDNQTGATLKGEVQMPVQETLGRLRAGPVLFVRVTPGQTWSSRDADRVNKEPEAVEDVVVRLADASLIAQSGPPLSFAYPARIGRATVTISDPDDARRPRVSAVDAAGNPVTLDRPPAPIVLPPDTRRPVLETPELKQDLFR